MGRPPLPPEELRDQILQLRVTRMERTRLEAAATKAGVTFAEWARLLLLASAGRGRAKRSR